MANQQVNEALNDYFSDLLGDAASDVNSDNSIAEDQNAAEPIVDITSDATAQAKTEATCKVTEVAKTTTEAIDETTVEATVEAKVELLEEQNEKESKQLPEKKIDVLLTQESGPNKLERELAQQTINDVPISVNEEQGVALPKVDLLSDSLSPIKEPVESRPVADAETDSFNEHKERLERMLRQVTTLTASSVSGVSSKAAIESETSVEADLDSNITQTREALAQEQSQAFEVSESEVTPQNELAEDTNTDLLEAPILGSQWNENGRPEWAQERFDILLLEIDGLQLAVPLVALGQIHEIDEEITPLFGQSGWFMGLQNTPDGNVKVVNTAKFIMPERSKDQHNYKYVISINGVGWGLAVDNIKQPITIDPEAIRWRPKRDSRPWMAGMVKDHMCVLLDIPKVGEILQTQDKNRVD